MLDKKKRQQRKHHTHPYASQPSPRPERSHQQAATLHTPNQQVGRLLPRAQRFAARLAGDCRPSPLCAAPAVGTVCRCLPVDVPDEAVRAPPRPPSVEPGDRRAAAAAVLLRSAAACRSAAVPRPTGACAGGGSDAMPPDMLPGEEGPPPPVGVDLPSLAGELRVRRGGWAGAGAGAWAAAGALPGTRSLVAWAAVRRAEKGASL